MKLVRCTPHEEWGTMVWHQHTFLLWKWWSAHSEFHKRNSGVRWRWRNP